MKAAVIYQKGSVPQYTDFPEPVIQSDDEVLVYMKAAALKHIDRSQSTGTHYSTRGDISKAKVIGGDGVGILANGDRVYAIGASGMLAEKAIVKRDRIVPLPQGLDDITAAALPNAVIGSAMGLRFRAGLTPGETVLINGATGFTGKVAVQIAKHYGAKKIIVTGRDPQLLQALLALGADEVISLMQDEGTLAAQIRNIHMATPIDAIIDYLWGHTAEIILGCLKGKGSFTHKTRFVSIGAVTGDIIRLSAENLRSVDLQLSGSGLGSWTKLELQQLFQEVLPEAFELAADKKIVVDTVQLNLKDIQNVWHMDIPSGKRLVMII